MQEKAGRKARFLVFGDLNAWQTAGGKASPALPTFVLPSVPRESMVLPRNRVFHGVVFADPVPLHYF